MQTEGAVNHEENSRENKEYVHGYIGTVGIFLSSSYSLQSHRSADESCSNRGPNTVRSILVKRISLFLFVHDSEIIFSFCRRIDI